MDEKEFPGARLKLTGRSRPTWFWFLPIVILLLVLLPGLTGFYADWLWFREVGYENIFLTMLRMKFYLGLIGGLLAAFFLWFNFKLALRLSSAVSKRVRYLNLNNEKVTLPDFGSIIERWGLPASLIAGLFFGIQIWESWDVILKYFYQTPFGNSAPPPFGRDIAFYIFTLPLLETGSQLLLVLTTIALIVSLLLYAMRNGISFFRYSFAIERGPRKHLFALLALVFLILAWRAWIDIPSLLYSSHGPFRGASYTDVNAEMPVLWIEVCAALLVAALALLSMFVYRNRWLLAGLGLYLLVAVLVGWIYPAFVQRFSVAPNELAKETPYIAYNIAATRKGYALDQIEESELTGEAGLTLRDIQQNKRTIDNIRLWDHGPLLRTFTQIQGIRNYYKFESIDNDRYQIGGELRQTMISPRELSVENLLQRNWINERLTYTHGYGVALGPVNQVTSTGMPVIFVGNLPPVTSLPTLQITRPELYYGELNQDPVYVKTSAKEFNFPKGEENVYTHYDGEGGVSIGSFWRRLLFAARFADMKLLLSNDMTPDSRVLFYRNINERLNLIAPFLTFDRDPYLVISQGRLFWIADGYTVSDRYPYSQPIDSGQSGEINYIRNSVKAVIDAYDGRTRLYIADVSDPLIQTWAKIFPGALRPLTEMPADLRAHLRYPEDIFRIQTVVYSTYHMDQPQIFYNKEDQWEAASVSGKDGQPESMEPYYTIMKLPGEKDEEFILMLPFTPTSKNNLSAWMAARADGEHYGHLRVYRFPKQKVILGPKQIIGLINQDTEISAQLTFWNQHGSAVIPGTLLVIPIKESLLYVQPLYLESEATKIPELKRVIVVAENRIAMEETLEASIAKIFGTESAPVKTEENLASLPHATNLPDPAGADLRSLAAQAKQHYDRAIQAQREGDWARYGEEIKQLGAALDKLSIRK
ncbi:MAG: UPF0182 family protein [Blastocatellia bacterium]|nr:UPF0182 family protein [Blastocatellia bacterium]